MNIYYNLSDPEVEKFLVLWFAAGEHQFGRKRYEKVDYSLEGYKKYIKKCLAEKKPAFHSVQPKASITKLFWEFDIDEKKFDISEITDHNSKMLDELWEQAKKLSFKIIDKGAMPLIVYSGRKGFHVWCFVQGFGYRYTKDEVRTAKATYKNMLKEIADDYDEYKNLDRHPLHVNALARIPFSFHQKTGNQVVPLNFERKPFIPDITKYIENKISKDFITDMSTKAATELTAREWKSEIFKSEIKDWEIRPCIEKRFRESPNHNVNLAMLLECIYAGFDDIKIHELFKTHKDYNYEMTDYQIKYQREQVEEEGIKPFKVETLKRMGICNDKMCKECGKCKKSKAPWFNK